MSIYVVVRSGDSAEHFPDNSPRRFRVMLNNPIRMNPQEWCVGLCELYCEQIALSDRSRTAGGGGEIYVNCNVCQSSLVGQSEDRLLRRTALHPKKAYLDVTFNPVFYLPVTVSECREILIEFKDITGRLATFITGPVSATLHFKRRPFIL